MKQLSQDEKESCGCAEVFRGRDGVMKAEASSRTSNAPRADTVHQACRGWPF